MADPIVDSVLDDIDPTKTEEEQPVTITPPPTGVTLSIEQYEELRRAAEQPRVEQTYTPPPQVDTKSLQQQVDEQFFTGSPSEASARVAREVMAPTAQAMNEKLGGLAIRNFMSSKTSDPFYQVVIGTFQKEISTMPKAALGAMDDAMIDRTLNLAWNSAIGQYVAKKQADKPKAPPVNLSGGSSAGGSSGPKEKKTLAEIDPISYKWALDNDMTDEQMAQLAEEILNEQD